MRMTVDKIRFAKQHAFNGTIYGYFVSLSDGKDRECRYYGTCPRIENGKVVVKKLCGADIPNALAKFLEWHKSEEFGRDAWTEDEVFTVDIFRAENPRIILK